MCRRLDVCMRPVNHVGEELARWMASTSRCGGWQTSHLGSGLPTIAGKWVQGFVTCSRWA